MAIRTTVVGSWPIPFGQRLELKRYYAGELSDEEASGVLTAAARIAMDEQLACGLDQIMGGEVFAARLPPSHPAAAWTDSKPLPRASPRRGQQGVGRYRVDWQGDRAARHRTREAPGAESVTIEPRLDKASVPCRLH